MMNEGSAVSAKQMVSELNIISQYNLTHTHELKSDIQGMALRLQVLEKKCDLMASVNELIWKRAIHLSLSDLNSIGKPLTKAKKNAFSSLEKIYWVNISFDYFLCIKDCVKR